MSFKRIPLPRGLFVKVDPDVFEWASKDRWCQHSSGYVFRWVRGEKGKLRPKFLHKEIMGAEKNQSVKIEGGDVLDLRRAKLLVCSKSQISHHSSKDTKRSKYHGVFRDHVKNKFVATITYQDETTYVGSFHKEKDAALAYDFYSRKFYGALAKINFPDKQITEEELLELRQKDLNQTSKYRGVSWHDKAGRWRARIVHEGKRIDLGFFDEQEQAALAYDKRNRKLKGPKAFQNFPKE